MPWWLNTEAIALKSQCKCFNYVKCFIFIENIYTIEILIYAQFIIPTCLHIIFLIKIISLTQVWTNYLCLIKVSIKGLLIFIFDSKFFGWKVALEITRIQNWLRWQFKCSWLTTFHTLGDIFIDVYKDLALIRDSTLPSLTWKVSQPNLAQPFAPMGGGPAQPMGIPPANMTGI